MDPENRHNASERRTPIWHQNPKGYVRSDERIFEDICECLMRDREVDTSQLRVSVHEGVAVLQGRVACRRDRTRIDQVAASVRGVREVDNQLRIESDGFDGAVDPALLRGVFGTLVHEHRAVAAMFEDVMASRRGAPTDRAALFSTLAQALLAHARDEDRVLYAALEAHSPAEVRRAREEHKLIAHLVTELCAGDASDEVWQTRVEVLRSLVELHVRGEEGQLFREALRVINPARAAALDEQYQRAKGLAIARAEEHAEPHARGSSYAPPPMSAPSPSSHAPVARRAR